MMAVLKRSFSAFLAFVLLLAITPISVAHAESISANLTCVTFPSETVGYAAGEGGKIYKSTDGGETWNPQASGTTKKFTGIAFWDTTHGVAVTEDRSVYGTENGSAWVQRNPDITNPGDETQIRLNGVAAVPGNTGTALLVAGDADPDPMEFFSYGPQLRGTSSAGANWSSPPLFEFTHTYLGDPDNTPYSEGLGDLFGIDFVTGTHGWAVGVDTWVGDDRDTGEKTQPQAIIARTTSTWVWQKQAVPVSTATLRAVSFADTSVGIAVGTGGTVFRTSNGGTTWIADTVGSSVTLNGVALQPGTDDGYAVGDGGAIFQTTDGGDTWTPFGSGTTNNLRAITYTGSAFVVVGNNFYKVLSGGTPPLNHPPVLDTIGDKTVDEGALLTFTATASDQDGDPLTYELVGDIPPGASITPGGVFSWTPTEAQGPHTYIVSVSVSDGEGGSDGGSIPVTVNEVNVAPVLGSIGDRGGVIGVPVTFTATATDADLPTNTLTFSLTGAPAGASIDPSTGAFTWTPTAAGSVTFTVRVFDGTVYDTEDITITVAATNAPPVLAAIGSKSVDELATLSFTASATDADGDALTFSLGAGAPAGASINPSTGAFSWTPTETQGPSSPSVTVTVSDGKGGSDSETITVTVHEVNSVPVLSAIGSRTIGVGQKLAFTATATDSDIPANTLRFSLDPGAAAGASITGGGAFSWTPAAAGSFPVTVRVSDGTASDFETVTVTVTEAPVELTVTEVEGADRIGTAIEAALTAFPEDAQHVVIATAYNWPDALGGAGLAGALDAPILLTRQNVLPPEVISVVQSLGVQRATILGGEGAVSTAVETALKGLLGAGNVDRLGGATRYDTAKLIAARTIQVKGAEWDGTAFVATGANFPDALGAAPLAAAKGWPIYLADPRSGGADLPATMTDAGVDRVLVLGGTGAIPTALEDSLETAMGPGDEVSRLAGGDRYATAVAVASYGVGQVGLTWDRLAVATGQDFPDALAGGPMQGRAGSVMLLTHTATLDTIVRDTLIAEADGIFEVRFLGGTGAVSPAVRTTVTTILAK